MMTDPIADLLTQVRNASKARLRKVDVSASQTKVSIVDVMKKTGLIKNYKLFRDQDRGVLRVYLRYFGKGFPVIRGMKRLSRPGRRVYCGYDNIPRIMGGLGITVVSTSHGIISDKMAREHKVGGELICAIW
jgi:small subunit ribosomal protein S8